MTYYKLFGGEWCCDEFYDTEESMTLSLGEGEAGYQYNPTPPTVFEGGLSANFGGAVWEKPPHSREDVLSVYTKEFTEDVFVKGKIKTKLYVKSDCEDTCFYVRLSLAKKEGDYGLRDDIQQISNFYVDYNPNEEISIDFSFDEHAFVILKGERLRIDIASSAFPLYVRHTNQKGLFSEQTETNIANNVVNYGKSYVVLPTT